MSNNSKENIMENLHALVEKTFEYFLKKFPDSDDYIDQQIVYADELLAEIEGLSKDDYNQQSIEMIINDYLATHKPQHDKQFSAYLMVELMRSAPQINFAQAAGIKISEGDIIYRGFDLNPDIVFNQGIGDRGIAYGDNIIPMIQVSTYNNGSSCSKYKPYAQAYAENSANFPTKKGWVYEIHYGKDDKGNDIYGGIDIKATRMSDNTSRFETVKLDYKAEINVVGHIPTQCIRSAIDLNTGKRIFNTNFNPALAQQSKKDDTYNNKSAIRVWQNSFFYIKKAEYVNKNISSCFKSTLKSMKDLMSLAPIIEDKTLSI
jgi:hypothetical protein